MSASTLHLLCAGAAQGLVGAIAPRFLAETGITLTARFGAVGAMKDALAAGAGCDVMVLSDTLVDALTTQGQLRAGSRAPLGQVHTGVAVRQGAPHPDVSTGPALRAALVAAGALYFPDAQRSTAGIHFASVLQRLGLDALPGLRLHSFPNGATAMGELAGAAPGAIGCTQVTEIVFTPRVELVGLLPEGFGLTTLYTAAVAGRAVEPAAAERFIALLTGEGTQAQRRRAGFVA